MLAIFPKDTLKFSFPGDEAIWEHGALVIPPYWETASIFSGACSSSNRPKIWIHQKDEALAIRARFDYVGGFEDALAVAVIGHGSDMNYEYIERTGRYAISPRFDDASDFSEGLVAVKPNN